MTKPPTDRPGALPDPRDPAASPAAGVLTSRGVPTPAAPIVRPRRLRRTPALRGLSLRRASAPPS